MSARGKKVGCLLAILVAMALAACASAPASSPVAGVAGTPSPTATQPTVAPTATRMPAATPMVTGAPTATRAPTATPTVTGTPTPIRATEAPTATVYVLAPHSCTDRAVFGERAASPYVLPYPPGESYVVLQSICNGPGSHRNQLAYDFGMPVGADVTAVRGGVVMLTGDNTPDIGTKEYQGQANFVYIRHEDGTVAFYAHLKQNSVTVRRGDQVEIGQRIAASGNSGYTGEIPHLHFGVYAWWPPEEGYDVPVNFRNATAFGALLPQGRYLALEY